ncbi:MAG: response regulator [Lachnospiraceae bacterium]|nr:response regulator [Lachnospiraceae bacterium]
MLKIFLAEDEFVVREGIKNNVDWAGHGYEFVGEASDGELAFPMIQRLKPDIVITDIKMPFMDGLELSRLIKKEFPWMEIIILSGYAEFEYAKEAISIGVAHYLTKPISGADLLKEIDDLAVRIEEKKQERNLREKYMHEMEEVSEEERRKLFAHMVTGDMSVTELLEQADALEMDITADRYNIMLLQMVSSHHTKAEYSGSVIEVYEKLTELVEKENALIFDRNLEGKAIILRAESDDELKKRQEELIEQIKEVLLRYAHITYYGGIGVPVGRLTELPMSYKKASFAYAHRYFTDVSEFRSCEEQEEERKSEDDFSISSVDPKEVDRSRLTEFLRKGQRGEIEYFIGGFAENIGENALRSNMFRQYLIMDAYFAVCTFVEEIGGDRQKIEAYDFATNDMKDMDAVLDYLKRIIYEALEIRDNSVNNRYVTVIDEVKRYIDENFADEELSLNKLASHVNFSPNHLSMIFSAQTGVTFIKYLTDYRMNKAKEMLRCTSLRSVDISMEVGYKDPHYFSYLFKKTQGMTPTRYRNGRDEEGNAEVDEE